MILIPKRDDGVTWTPKLSTVVREEAKGDPCDDDCRYTRRGKERIYTHSSRLLRCTDRNASIIIGVYVTGDWPESMGAFYFMSKGLREDIEKRGLRVRVYSKRTAAAAPSLDGDTPSRCRCRPTVVVGEIKSIRFPRVSGLSSRRGHKIRHRRRRRRFTFSLRAIISACLTSGTKYKI